TGPKSMAGEARRQTRKGRDSCRSRPPLRAARTPVPRPALPSPPRSFSRAPRRANDLDDIAGRDRMAASARLHQHQPAGAVDRLEAPGELPVSKLHTDHLAETRRAREPVRPDGGKMLSPVPLGAPPQHLG